MKKILLILPIRILLFITIFLLMIPITNKKLNELTYTWSIVCTIVNIIVIILLIIIAKMNDKTYLDIINYQKNKTKFKDILIISLIILSIGMGGMYLSGLIFYQEFPYIPIEIISPIKLFLAIINLLLLPITTALAEDGLYLGVGVNNINNKYLKIIIPGLFFALQHSFIPLLFDIKFMAYRFISFLPLTFILAYIYAKKKNPLPIIIGHALIDLCTSVTILIMSINPDIYNKLLNM